MKLVNSDCEAQVISLLSSGLSVRRVASRTHHSIGAIGKLRPEHLPGTSKDVGGHPRKVTDTSTRHIIHLLGSGKVENAVQVSRVLRDITNTPGSSQTVRWHLQQAGLKAAVKEKKPVLSVRHGRHRLDYAIAHQDWTAEDWKRVIWSDETRINRLGSDGRV